MDFALELIASLGSLLLALCAVPLVIDVVRNKSAKALPWMFLASWGIGEVLVAVYGFYFWLIPVMLNTTLNLICAIIIFGYKVCDE